MHDTCKWLICDFVLSIIYKLQSWVKLSKFVIQHLLDLKHLQNMHVKIYIQVMYTIKFQKLIGFEPIDDLWACVHRPTLNPNNRMVIHSA